MREHALPANQDAENRVQGLVPINNRDKAVYTVEFGVKCGVTFDSPRLGRP